MCANFPNSISDRIQIVAIGGLSIAQELAARRHTCVIISTNQALLSHLALARC